MLMLMLVLVLGVLAITTEFRHGTASTTFLATPRRYPVMVAKPPGRPASSSSGRS